MAQRYQRGWLKKEARRQGKTWVLFFRMARKSDGKRVENKVPIGLRLCHISPGKRVLDVASGTGESACCLAEEFACNVTGIDQSDFMVSSDEILLYGTEGGSLECL